MDPYRRGRAPSQENMHGSIRKSPSPHPPYLSHSSHAVDPAAQPFANHPAGLAPNQPYQQSYDTVPHYNPSDFPDGQQYSLNAFDHTQDNTFAHTQDTAQFGDFQHPSSGNDLAFDSFDPQNTFHDSSNLDPSFQSSHLGDSNFDPSQPFDDSDFLNLDPNLQDLHSFNPNTSLPEDMSTLQYKTPEAPHLLQPDMQHSVHPSPTVYHDAQSSVHHSRTTSLDPAAAYAHGSEWTAFRGHRRTPSDQHSDMSSHNASPHIGGDAFEQQNPSPMLNGSGDPSVFGPDALGLSHFSLTDSHNPSPGHSAHHSPYLGPQQGQQLFPAQDDFTLMSNEAQYNAFQGQEVFPSTEYLQQNLQDPGQADQMSPPQITFDPAPPSKQNSILNLESMGATERHTDNNLSPPLHSGRINRQRAVSDPYVSGPSSYDPSTSSRSRSPSLGLHPADSLSAARARSSSPGPNNGIQKHYRRSSSPAVTSPTSRERMVEMGIAAQSSPQASDNGSAAGSPGSTSETSPAPNPKNSRSKHPANYQCTLCPKRFTRAYNLRSHLRTHTDERPFVCTICTKAFARQHDRKRHEGLHSGEKKFVCRGNLTDTAGQNNGHWGCGRRFARADALGRHFRSEAGRACIKPLLDEEARQRQDYAMEQRQMLAAQSHLSQPAPMPANMSGGMGGVVDLGNMPLPAALLAQYPALAGIDFSAPMMNGADYDGVDGYENYDHSEFEDGPDFGGRSSFEASSGGEEPGYFGAQDVDAGARYGVPQQGNMQRRAWS